MKYDYYRNRNMPYENEALANVLEAKMVAKSISAEIIKKRQKSRIVELTVRGLKERFERRDFYCSPRRTNLARNWYESSRTTHFGGSKKGAPNGVKIGWK